MFCRKLKKAFIKASFCDRLIFAVFLADFVGFLQKMEKYGIHLLLRVFYALFFVFLNI